MMQGLHTMWRRIFPPRIPEHVLDEIKRDAISAAADAHEIAETFQGISNEAKMRDHDPLVTLVDYIIKMRCLRSLR